MENVKQDSVWVPDPLNHYRPNSVSKKHGKLITFLRTFMKSRPTKQKLKQRGILRERVFGCDLGEHLLNSGHDVPQVLKSCTEFIEKHGVVDGMYRLSGIASNIQKLRHEFDSEQIPDLTKDVYIQDIHCVGSLCKLYFRELPNPLLTYQLYEKFSEAVSAATDEERLIKIHDVIQQLPPPHYRTLEFLMRHLSHLATFSYVTNMHIKNLAIVWAPNLLRSKQIESACFSGTAAFMEVRIQSVVVEFILNHVDVLFSPKLSSLIREGAGHNSLSRPKSLLVSSPSTKLLTLEEAQARTQAQINSPVTADSKYIEVGEGPAALQGKFHTVIEFPTERKRPPIKSKKSPVGSWRSFFSLGKSSSMAKRKLQRNPSEPNELKAMALAGGRGDTGTLRSAKSEESLTSLHNVEGESKVYRPRRPRSSSDALSASFNGDLLDGRHHCNSYDNLGQGDSDGDEGPICVPALISPPRSAEDMDLSPPDIGVASLDFDPMSFQCSLPLGEPSFPSPELGGEAGGLRTSPGASFSEPVSPSPEKALSPFLASPDFSPALGGQAESKKHATATLAEKVVQAFSPKMSQKSIKLPSLAVSEPAVASTPNQTPETDGPQPPSPAQAPQGSLVPPPNMIAMLLKTNEAAPSEGTLLELPGKVPENRDHTIKECTEASGPTGPVLPPTQQGLGTAGAVGMDSSQAPAPVSSVSLLPPPPPPKNAARILALALAESAQQASFFTQRRPSGPPTPMSPLDTLEWPPPPPLPPPATPELVTDRDASPMPAFSSPPLAASPAESRALVASSHLTKSNSTWPPAASNANQDSAPVDTSDSLTESVKGTSPATPQPPQISLSQKSPERQQPALGQVPVTSYSSTTTSSTSISPSTTTTSTTTTNNDLGAMPHMETRVGVDITSSIPKPAEQSTTTVQPPANTWTSAVPTTPTEQADKPWEAPKAAHPRTDPVPVYQAYGPTPPTPPVRSIESKLATAALSNTEAANASNFHTILAEAAIPSSVEEALPQPPRPPRKPSVLQPAYMYHPKAESTLEAAAEAYYHQRVMPVGQPSMAYHYRPDSVPPHLSYASKSEPQIIYSARSDGRYNTIGPRSFHQSIKSRGPHRGEYIPGGSSGHRSQGYGPMDSAMVYPTIRRVHSLHVPPTAIRSVPITRTEVPPDDELYYYQRPIYQCKPYQQPVQSDYHVTQLQPYFENGRVQYRYSPYSSTSPLDAPYYDVDPYGTIRLRHFHSFSSRDLAPPLNRAGAKAGNYHYLSRHVLPSGREHSFVSRDMPPSHSSKGASVYLAMDPEESERLRMHSVRRENRARQKAKGPVMSQYDNVSPFIPGDPGGMEVLHLRSKSDPGKTVLMTAEGKDGRYGVMPASQHPPRHLLSDPDVFMYMETEKHYQGNGMADKPAVPLKPSGSHSNQTGYHHPQHPHQPPPQPAPRNLPPHQEPSRPDSKGDPGDSKQGSGGSRHWPECPEPRGHPSRYERSDQDRHAIRIAPVSTASYPEEEPQVAPVKPVPPPKPERSHSMRERHHYHQPNPSTIHLQENPEREHCGSYSYQSHGQRHSTMTMLSHYDNLDDYHPVSQTQSQTPVSSRGGTAPYATPGFTTPQSARAYSTALGQGAFLPAELSLQRPETEIHAE